MASFSPESSGVFRRYTFRTVVTPVQLSSSRICWLVFSADVSAGSSVRSGINSSVASGTGSFIGSVVSITVSISVTAGVSGTVGAFVEAGNGENRFPVNNKIPAIIPNTETAISMISHFFFFDVCRCDSGSSPFGGAGRVLAETKESLKRSSSTVSSSSGFISFCRPERSGGCCLIPDCFGGSGFPEEPEA